MKIKMICIKELFEYDISTDGVILYNPGDFYEYDGSPSFVMFNICEVSGTLYLKSKNMDRKKLYEHFMSYNEWLALERERQIDSIFK